LAESIIGMQRALASWWRANARREQAAIESSPICDD
jgi:hypothetical protein